MCTWEWYKQVLYDVPAAISSRKRGVKVEFWILKLSYYFPFPFPLILFSNLFLYTVVFRFSFLPSFQRQTDRQSIQYVLYSISMYRKSEIWNNSRVRYHHHLRARERSLHHCTGTQYLTKRIITITIRALPYLSDTFFSLRGSRDYEPLIYAKFEIVHEQGLL